jgi:hypothetical protein
VTEHLELDDPECHFDHKGQCLKPARARVIRTDVRDTAPNPTCCSNPAALCRRCQGAPVARTDAADPADPDYLAGLAYAESRMRQHGAGPRRQARPTPNQESHESPMSKPTPAEAERKRRYLASIAPLNGRTPTAQEQVRLDAAERDYDQRIANAQDRSSHYTRQPAPAVTRLDGGRDNADELTVDDVSKARKRMKARAANAWREPLDKEGQARLDQARLLRDEADDVA